MKSKYSYSPRRRWGAPVRSVITNNRKCTHLFRPIGGAGWGLRNHSQPLTKYHTAWAVKCCHYCCNCMFCFQPNELRWCVPVWDCNINRKTLEEPPRSLEKWWWAYLSGVMNSSLSLLLPFSLSHVHTHAPKYKLEVIFSQLTVKESEHDRKQSAVSVQNWFRYRIGFCFGFPDRNFP